MRTAEERLEVMRNAAPPTPDDCPILNDGTRIDTREKGIAFLIEMREISRKGHEDDARRAAQQTLIDNRHVTPSGPNGPSND